MKLLASLLLATGLLLIQGISNSANSQIATSDSVCVPKYQMDGIMADLADLDEYRATADSAHRAMLVLTGQKAQLTTDNGRLGLQLADQQQQLNQQRGRTLNDTLKAIGSTTLKVGAVIIGLWLAIRL